VTRGASFTVEGDSLGGGKKKKKLPLHYHSESTILFKEKDSDERKRAGRKMEKAGNLEGMSKGEKRGNIFQGVPIFRTATR